MLKKGKLLCFLSGKVQSPLKDFSAVAAVGLSLFFCVSEVFTPNLAELLESYLRGSTSLKWAATVVMLSFRFRGSGLQSANS